MSIGFIGCGNMASAIISGIVENNAVKAEEINVFDVYSPAVDSIKSKYNVNSFSSEIEVANNSDIIILAVKPNILAQVLNTIDSAINTDKLIISIAAGKTIDFITSKLTNDAKIIRVMPNINAKVCEAICAYTANSIADEKDKLETEKLFSSVGEIIYLEENYFPLFGVLGGCTPAMAYMFIDELARAGVKNGMKKDVALKIAAQAVLGSAKMILESDEHPYDLIDKVCSPGGTTIEAITSLQNDSFEATIHKAVDKAIEKDAKL